MGEREKHWGRKLSYSNHDTNLNQLNDWRDADWIRNIEKHNFDEEQQNIASLLELDKSNGDFQKSIVKKRKNFRKAQHIYDVIPLQTHHDDNSSTSSWLEFPSQHTYSEHLEHINERKHEYLHSKNHFDQLVAHHKELLDLDSVNEKKYHQQH